MDKMVYGQNSIGQNGTDKISIQTKWYMDKMVWTKWYGQNGTNKISIQTKWYTDKMV